MDRPASTRPSASRAGLGGLLIVACLAAACAGRRDVSTVPGAAPGAAFERGIASWYGGKFHGRRTASGERFDKHELTAAHRTLEFGTVVRVERVDTGESVVVRINDRGPFVDGRIIDLSRAAAMEIDLIRDGLALVELYLLE